MPRKQPRTTTKTGKLTPNAMRELRANIEVGDTIVVFDEPAGSHVKGTLIEVHEDLFGIESYKIKIMSDSKKTSGHRSRVGNDAYVPVSAANDWLSRVIKIYENKSPQTNDALRLCSTA